MILLTTTTAARKKQKTTAFGGFIINPGFCFIFTPTILPTRKPTRTKAVTATTVAHSKMDAEQGNAAIEQAPSTPEAATAPAPVLPGKVEDEAKAEVKAEIEAEAEVEEIAVRKAELEAETTTAKAATVATLPHSKLDAKEGNAATEQVPSIPEATIVPVPDPVSPGKEETEDKVEAKVEVKVETEAEAEVKAETVYPIAEAEAEIHEEAKANASGFSLVFEDFLDLQTRMILLPFIEEEGKGAIVASYPEDDQFEGLLLASMNDEEKEQSLQTMDFTDILAGLREQSRPIHLQFEENKEEEEEKGTMIDVDLCENENKIDEEKKEDDSCAKPKESADANDANVKTPTTSNHEGKSDNTKPNTESLDKTSLLSLSPKPTYLERRQTTASKEHTNSLNSVLDDHRSRGNDNNNNDSTTGNSTTLSSGMFALSSWGMRMKAQSEKLLATAGAKATQQIQKQSAAAAKPSQHKSSTSRPPHCDMYLQTNLGAYFPISKTIGKGIKPQHLQAITTSSLYCIRKSATEHCTAGRTTIYNNNPVRYSFQWYRSSSEKTSSRRDRFPMSPSTLYNSNNTDNSFDCESIGDSTLTSKLSRAYSSADSLSSSCSSWSSSSSSSNSSSSCSSYSMSTNGVTNNTVSLPSVATGTNTIATRTTTKGIHKDTTTAATSWIPLKGATGASFQPNTTLVGKRLRCVVTLRPVRGNSSDEEDEGNRRQQQQQQQPFSSSTTNHHKGSSASLSSKDSSSASAIMDADDNNDDDKTDTNDVSISKDNKDDILVNEARSESLGGILDDEEGVKRIVCDLAIPIQADMVLFNGAKQAMMARGSANFGNLVGRGGEETSTNTPAIATSASGKTFRIEVGSTRKTVLYTSSPPSLAASASASTLHQQQQQRAKPQRRIMNVNSVQIYCRSSPQDEYVKLTDIPLLQVTARASPTNSKYVDLLFPAIPLLLLPPSDVGRDGENKAAVEKSSTQTFFSDYCIMDHASSFERGIPRLELEAPNRMTRESFLLALGIANYWGKSMQLDNKKVLYRDDEPILRQINKQQQQQASDATASSPKTSPKSNSQCGSPSFRPLSPSSPLQSSIQQSQEPKVKDLKKDVGSDSVSGTSGGKNGRQALSGNLTLSPCRPSDVIGGSKNVLSPISCQFNPEINPRSVESEKAYLSIPGVPAMPSVAEFNAVRVKDLEREMEKLRAQLARKDKIVTELQRQVQGSEAAHKKTKHALTSNRQELKQSQEDCERIQMSKRHVERSMQSQHEATQKIESDHRFVVNGFEGQLQKQADKISELEKLNRALQNEKAVLGATVEARESKLVKLDELQVSNSELSKKVAQQGTLEAQLEESRRKHERLQKEFESRKDVETNCRKELEAAKATIETIHKRIRGEKDKASSCQSQLETIQKKNQQLTGERNSYKQKNESLSKEVARLCRGGKNIRDIEKVLSDHESLLQETELLRAQKRKALEDAHKYRTSLEQAKAAEELLSLNPDEKETRRIIERTAELERLLSEMTDYVSAKQMQLDTMKEINEELQREIHSLAQANLRRDEV